ncbi:MAG: hypothetical protein IKZ87_03615, partial [Actinomycetaceae bacterium]|nr:hypothetical protein [Actinomycetaceae bacterium]
MVTVARAKRIFSAFIAFAMLIGFTVVGAVTFADDLPACSVPQLEGTSDSELIVVKETVKLSGSCKLDLASRTLKRADGLLGPIIEIEKNADVVIEGKNASIDGGDEVKADAPMVAVDGATLTISGPTFEYGINSNSQVYVSDRSNAVPTDTWAGMGGALGARASTITIKDVQFGYNRATLGGAIFVEGTSLTLKDKVIFNDNFAVWEGAEDFHGSRSFAAGGAIMATSFYDRSTITIEDVIFQENKAPAGGAIALGRNHANNEDAPSIASEDEGGNAGFTDASLVQEYAFNSGNAKNTQLVINNAHFEKNAAESAGGAIFVQSNTTAEIYGGKFSGNEAKGELQEFAGGAIYVQDSKKDGNVTIPAGRLIIKNALITGNEAASDGDAIALCATGDGFVGYTEGASIFDNGNGSHGEVAVYAKQSQTVSLSAQALGNVKNNWEGDGDPTNITSKASFRNVLNGVDKEKAKAGARVVFEGNRTGRKGGALAVNGALEIGQQAGSFYIKKVDFATQEVLGGAEFTLT